MTVNGSRRTIGVAVSVIAAVATYVFTRGVTTRRLGAHEPGWPPATGPAAALDVTLIEMRLDGKGSGEAKASLTAPVVVDAAAKTLALDGYAAAPTLLKVTR